MRIEPRQYLQHGRAVPDAFAHPYNTAAAHLKPSGANGSQSREPVLVGAGRHDIWVEFGARIEIVVIGRQPRLLQPFRLALVQHTQRNTGFHPKCPNTTHHIEHRVESCAIADVAPCRSHAEAVSSGCFRARGDVEHGIGCHHIDLVETHLAVMRGLWTIGAIFWASAGFNAEKTRLLDIADCVNIPVKAVRPRDQVEQRQIVNRNDFIGGPIMAKKLAGFCMGHLSIPMVPRGGRKLALANRRLKPF